MHEVLVNRLGGLTLARKSVVRLTDRPDMTLDVNRGRKITTHAHNNEWTDGQTNEPSNKRKDEMTKTIYPEMFRTSGV